MKQRSQMGIASLIFGYGFLYIPLLFLIIFSFNDSKFPGYWVGLSLRWYQALFENTDLMDAAWKSFQIACLSATFSVVLGTLSAFVLERHCNRFFQTLVRLPLVMPELLIGLSLLLFFVGLYQLFGIPKERGFLTVVMGHTTVAMSYVTLVVQARLSDFDRSLEEAALDLGAKPLIVFCSVTLPCIRSALLASWLLAFALSLDDVVLASFLSGPGATTLPVLIFSSLRLGLTPEVNALATLIMLFLTLVMGGFGFYLLRQDKKNKRKKALIS